VTLAIAAFSAGTIAVRKISKCNASFVLQQSTHEMVRENILICLRF
jgi:hypothetical protein